MTPSTKSSLPSRSRETPVLETSRLSIRKVYIGVERSPDCGRVVAHADRGRGIGPLLAAELGDALFDLRDHGGRRRRRRLLTGQDQIDVVGGWGPYLAHLRHVRQRVAVERGVYIGGENRVALE